MPSLLSCPKALIYLALLASTLRVAPLFAQHDGSLDLSADRLGQEIDLSKILWRYHPGDDPAWSVSAVPLALITIESVRVVVQAIRKKKEGAWIIAIGVLVFLLAAGIMRTTGAGIMTARTVLPENLVRATFYQYLGSFYYLPLPIMMSVFLARRFACAEPCPRLDPGSHSVLVSGECDPRAKENS